MTRERDEEQGYVDWVHTLLDDEEQWWRSAVNPGAGHGFEKQRANRIEEIVGSRSELVFGRLDLVDDETMYVGRTGVKDPDGDIRVVNWQAHAAAAFYQADRVSTRGVGRRRTIKMRGRKVVSVSDDVLVRGFRVKSSTPAVVVPPVTAPVAAAPSASPATEPSPAAGVPAPAPHLPVEPTSGEPYRPTRRSRPVRERVTLRAGEVNFDDLRAPDLLLEELEKDRTGRLEDIVATIQADQDRLIRAASDRPLIIQGGPGTGKTVVALHRVSYLMYHRLQAGLDASMLVVGPNRRFMEYVSEVLPALGDVGVAQHDLASLALTNVPKSEADRVSVRGSDHPSIARLKGDVRMAEVIDQLVWSRATVTPIEVGVDTFVLRLSADEVTRLLRTVRAVGTPWADARLALQHAIVQALVTQYVERARRSGGLAPATSRREEVAQRVAAHLRASEYLTNTIPAQSARDVVLRLLTEEDPLGGWTPRGVSAAQLRRLRRERTRGRAFEWSAADLPLVDEAAFVLRGAPQGFAHVVVDEAQDLSAMQWRMIARRVRGRSVTVLGDLAQATEPGAGLSWDHAIEHGRLTEAVLAELPIGYRVPAEVMHFANRLLPTVAPGLNGPRSTRSVTEPVVVKAPSARLLAAEVANQARSFTGGQTLVVCVPTFTDAVRRELDGVAATVLAPSEVKGLEFDNVIVVEPATIAAASKKGHRLLYVALTRTTKRLSVIHHRDLPKALRDGAVDARLPENDED